MFLIEESPNLFYRINYTSYSYSDLDLQILLKGSDKVGNGYYASMFLRIKTYFSFSISIPDGLTTYYNEPILIPLLPNLQSTTSTQEIRLSDYTVSLNSQVICILSLCQNIDLVYSYNQNTQIYIFYADLSLSVGNYCMCLYIFYF